MTRYLLDTNIVSHLLKGHPLLMQQIAAKPMKSICVSSITVGELFYGLAKRPTAKRLHSAVREFLRCAEVLPWDTACAERYGATRAELEHKGKPLAALDLLIAAHALTIDAVLVSNDHAFAQVVGLKLQDWTQSVHPRTGRDHH